MIWLAIKGAVSAMSWVKICLVVAALLAVVTAGAVIVQNIWERGYAWAISDIAAQDQKAIGAATEKRNAFLDCRSRGLRWDQATGECQGR